MITAKYRIDASEESRISGNIPQKILAFCQERGIDLSTLDFWNRGIIEIPLPEDAKALEGLISEWNEVDEGQHEARILFGPATGTEHTVSISYGALPGGNSWQC